MATLKDKTNKHIKIDHNNENKFTMRKRRNRAGELGSEHENKGVKMSKVVLMSQITPSINDYTYEYILNNPTKWPNACDMNIDRWKEFYQHLIKRRDVIRKHFENDDSCQWLLRDNYQVSVDTDIFHHMYDYLYENEWRFGVLGKDYLEHKDIRLYRYRYRFVNKYAVLRQKLNLCSDTFHLAVAIFDRYAKVERANLIPEDLNFVSIICLNIAMKMEEVMPHPLETLFHMYNITEYNEKLCVNFERKVCNTIDFRLTIPLSVQFIRMYAVLCDGDSAVYNAARYCIDLSLQDYVASQYSVNFVAASCLFLALVCVNEVKDKFDEVWIPKLQCASGLTYGDMYPLIRNLCLVLNKQFYQSEYHKITDYYKASEDYTSPAVIVLNSTGLSSLNEMFLRELNLGNSSG